MCWRQKIKRVISSWDLWISLMLSVTVWIFLPFFNPTTFLKNFYLAGLTTLSIIFSVYFAALSLIISSSDNSFIRFLKNKNIYAKILFNFKFTLTVVFIALLMAVALFLFSGYQVAHEVDSQRILFLALFIFFFSYSLFSTFKTAKFAIEYADHRAKFLEKKSENTQEEKFN